MILASSSLSSPGLTSTSTPRSLKMATAAEESLSEMRTRGAMGNPRMRRRFGRDLRRKGRKEGAQPARARATTSGRLGELHLLDRKGVVEPGGQRLDVVGLDGRPAPYAQARRRVAIGADVVGDLLLFQEARERLGERALPVQRQRGH